MMCMVCQDLQVLKVTVTEAYIIDNVNPKPCYFQRYKYVYDCVKWYHKVGGWLICICVICRKLSARVEVGLFVFVIC